MPKSLWFPLGCLMLFLLSHASAGESSDPNSLVEAITGGKVDVNVRVRAELVKQDNLKNAQAYTGRIRLGYGTQAYYGFSAYSDFEATGTLDYSLYNAAGLNGQPNRAVVADPVDSEINQIYLKYVHKGHQGIAGRQRIILDDARFVGNVGWRQLEQTFDAATYRATFQERIRVHYSYLSHVRRVFGQSSGMDFKSDSHILNFSGDISAVGTLTGFAYLLDFDNSAANSSNTFGARYQGSFNLNEDLTLKPIASLAYQEDAGSNPANYSAPYVLAEAGLAKKDLGSAGAGYELLGSDNGKFGFRTPLATGHAWNGWADVFLTTPANGLQDVYGFVGAPLPWDSKGKLYYHRFYSDQGGAFYGHEFDAVASKTFTQNIKGLVKLAVYDGKTVAGAPEVAADRIKLWLQGELIF